MFTSTAILALALVAAAPKSQIGTIDGNNITGQVQQLSSEQITLKTADGDKTVPAGQVLYLTQQSPSQVDSAAKPSIWIELTDGSRLTASSFVLQNGTAICDLGPGLSQKLPESSLRLVRFAGPDGLAAPAWPATVSADATGDLLVVRKKDQVDFMEGSIGQVDENAINLKVDGENYPVNRSKVAGIIFFHKTGEQLPDPSCVVETTAGWRLKASNVALQNDQLEITLLGGMNLNVPWDSVTRLDFSGDKIIYLTDLDPSSVQWTPFLSFGAAVPALPQYYAPRHDAGPEHQPLSIGGKTYSKGLGLYSRTAVEYRVPAGVKKFKATAGIDDSMRDAGNVRLQITADGKTLFEQALTGKDAPAELDLDIAGAKRLSILVDYGDQFDAGDFLDLADARMLK